MENLHDISPEIIEALAQSPMFKKIGKVIANSDGAGNMIVLDLNGGKTTLTDKIFISLYEATDDEGVYRPVTYCRAAPILRVIHNERKTPVEASDLMIVGTCDSEGNLNNTPHHMDSFIFEGIYVKM